MKLIRRNKYINPMNSTPLWLIPGFTYGLGKLMGVEYNVNEYLWWILIPTMFIIWGLLNWKVKWK